MIKEYQVNLTEKQNDFIEWVVNGYHFPLYSFYSNTHGEHVNPVFGHIFRDRPENNTKWMNGEHQTLNIWKCLRVDSKIFVTKTI